MDYKEQQEARFIAACLVLTGCKAEDVTLRDLLDFAVFVYEHVRTQSELFMESRKVLLCFMEYLKSEHGLKLQEAYGQGSFILDTLHSIETYKSVIENNHNVKQRDKDTFELWIEARRIVAAKVMEVIDVEKIRTFIRVRERHKPLIAFGSITEAIGKNMPELVDPAAYDQLIAILNAGKALLIEKIEKSNS